MGSGSQQSVQDTYQNRDPYAAAKPGLQRIADAALNIYNQNPGGSVYTGDRTAGLSGTTQAGLRSLVQNANGGMGAVRAGDNFTQDLLRSGGSTADTDRYTQGVLNVGTTSTQGLQNLAQRMADPNSGANAAAGRLTGGEFFQDEAGYNRLNQGLAGPTQVQQSLQDVASGKFLGDANPYMNDMIAQAQADAANKVKGTFAASGRYGSGAFGSSLGDTVARVGTEYRYKDYEAERARQAQAAQLIDAGLLSRTAAQQSLYGSANDTRTANANQVLQGGNLNISGNQAALQGATALAGQRNINNQQRINQQQIALQAAQADRSAAQNSVGQLGQIQDAYLRPGKTILAAGQIRDQARQAELGAQQARFNEQQNAPWKQLGLLSQTTLPVAGAGGTTSGQTVTTQEGPSVGQQILGGVAAGVGLLGQTGAFGPAGMVAGTAANAAGGWLTGPSGLLSPSAAPAPAPMPVQSQYNPYVNPQTGQPYTYNPNTGYL